MTRARFPITSNEEMKGFNHLAKDNQGIRDYLIERAGNGEAQGDLNDHSFWLGYIEGNTDALADSAKLGAILFYTSVEDGGANCVSCYSGDYFTDEKFHNIAAPQMGHGKGDGASGHEDFGRYRETKQDSDMFAFRTPSLVNVAKTGSWMHSGAYEKLIDAVKHSVNAKQAIEQFNNIVISQQGVQNKDMITSFAQKAMDSENYEGSALDFTERDIEDLVSFLNALTDPCITDRECMIPWLLNHDENQDSNGYQVIAID